MSKRVLSFEIPLKPVAKQRPRQGKGFTYTPKKTKGYENAVAVKARAAFNDAKMAGAFDGPIELFIKVFLARPKRLNPDLHPRTKISRDPIPHSITPDLDNLVKSVSDGINKSGVWADDARVFHVDAQKHYVAHGDLPSVEVTIIEGV